MDHQWEVGGLVEVQSRTWAGINKPGGCAKITKVYMTDSGDAVIGLDVKYLVGGGSERQIDPCLCAPFESLARGGRKRRGREFLHDQQANDVLSTRNANVDDDVAKTTSSSNKLKKKIPTKGKTKLSKNTSSAQSKTKKNAVEPDIDEASCNSRKSGQSTRSMDDDNEDEDGEESEIGTEAAVEESRQQEQPSSSTTTSTTTFSTPLQQKKRSRSSSSKPTKVTPIPSLVITNTENPESVSPMFPDSSVTIMGRDDDGRDDDNNNNNARRGLFENVTQSNVVESNQKNNSTTNHHRRQHRSVETTSVTGQNKRSHPPSSGINHQSSQQQRNLGLSILSKKDHVFAARGGIDRITGSRKQQTQSFVRSRTLSELKKPPPSTTTTTTTSAAAGTTQQDKYASSSSSSSYTNKKEQKAALKDVYQYELQKARDFMNQMVGPAVPQHSEDKEEPLKKSDCDDDNGPISSNSTTPSSSRNNKKEDKNIKLEGFIRTSTRYDEFLSIFQTLRLQIDDGGGQIDEIEFKQRFQSMAGTTPFEDDQLDGHITSLCNEGKIMKSDGVLYLID